MEDKSKEWLPTNIAGKYILVVCDQVRPMSAEINQNTVIVHITIDVPQPLTNDLWVFLFQTIDAECVK